jgi:ChrB-like protein
LSTLWLLFIYKVPPEPSARRVYVWRKLKRLGAILLHDSAWVLPATDWTREQLQWLSGEITDQGGEAMLWEADLWLHDQSERLKEQFAAQVEAAYQEILTQLAKTDADVEALARQYQQIKMQDYFQSSLADEVRRALVAARGGESGK